MSRQVRRVSRRAKHGATRAIRSSSRPACPSWSTVAAAAAVRLSCSTNWHDHGSRAHFPAPPGLRHQLVRPVRCSRAADSRDLQQHNPDHDLQLPYLTEYGSSAKSPAGSSLDRRMDRLTGWAPFYLNQLGDNPALSILIGEQLVADRERVLGADHPQTLSSRNNLANAYRAAGRTD